MWCPVSFILHTKLPFGGFNMEDDSVAALSSMEVHEEHESVHSCSRVLHGPTFYEEGSSHLSSVRMSLCLSGFL